MTAVPGPPAWGRSGNSPAERGRAAARLLQDELGSVAVPDAWELLAEATHLGAQQEAADVALELLRTSAVAYEPAVVATRLLRRLARRHRSDDPPPPVPTALLATVTNDMAGAALRGATREGRLDHLRDTCRRAAATPRSPALGRQVRVALRALEQVHAVLDGRPAPSGHRPETDGTRVPCPCAALAPCACGVCDGDGAVDLHVLATHASTDDRVWTRLALERLVDGLRIDGAVVPPWDAPTMWQAIAGHWPNRDLPGRDAIRGTATAHVAALRAWKACPPDLAAAVEHIVAPSASRPDGG